MLCENLKCKNEIVGKRRKFCRKKCVDLAYYYRHKGKKLQYQKEYDKRNKERKKQYMKEWKKRNPDYLRKRNEQKNKNT